MVVAQCVFRLVVGCDCRLRLLFGWTALLEFSGLLGLICFVAVVWCCLCGCDLFGLGVSSLVLLFVLVV